MRAPSERSLQVLAFMREFFATNDQLPPADAIASHFGWASANAAQAHINALLKHRLVERNACGKLRFARTPAQETAQ
jgi:SOS-response transcriptional repressor LexA